MADAGSGDDRMPAQETRLGVLIFLVAAAAGSVLLFDPVGLASRHLGGVLFGTMYITILIGVVGSVAVLRPFPAALAAITVSFVVLVLARLAWPRHVMPLVSEFSAYHPLRVLADAINVLFPFAAGALWYFFHQRLARQGGGQD